MAGSVWSAVGWCGSIVKAQAQAQARRGPRSACSAGSKPAHCQSGIIVRSAKIQHTANRESSRSQPGTWQRGGLARGRPVNVLLECHAFSLVRLLCPFRVSWRRTVRRSGLAFEHPGRKRAPLSDSVSPDST